MWDPYSEFKSAVLPNGLTIHAAHWPGREWEAAAFLVHSGAETDPAGLEGIAHFVEHLISDNFTISQKEMKEMFEEFGGSATLGTTTFLNAYYRFFVPIDRQIITKAAAIFGEMMFSARLQNNIERQRRIIQSEYRRDYPSRLKHELQSRRNCSLFGDTFLGRSTSALGRPDAIKKISEADLQAYYDRHYVPANVSVICVGGMEFEELCDMFRSDSFGVMKPGKRNLLPYPDDAIVLPLETEFDFKISDHQVLEHPIETGTYESHARLPGTIGSKAVSVFSEMLNGVLFEEAREKRTWTYHIECGWTNLYQFFQFHIRCDSLSAGAFDEVSGVIETSIESVGRDKRLFERVKKRRLAKSRILDVTGQEVCNTSMNEIAYYGRIFTIEEDNRELEAVTMEEISRIAELLSSKYRWTMIQRP